MRKEYFNIIVDDVEKRILIQALSELKDQQKLENKNFDFIDDLIIKVCDAPMAKGRFNQYAKYQTR